MQQYSYIVDLCVCARGASGRGSQNEKQSQVMFKAGPARTPTALRFLTAETSFTYLHASNYLHLPIVACLLTYQPTLGLTHPPPVCPSIFTGFMIIRLWLLHAYTYLPLDITGQPFTASQSASRCVDTVRRCRPRCGCYRLDVAVDPH